MKKNWKERMKAIIVLILEAGFCLYLAWVIINGFIICPEGLSQKELIRYLFSCFFLVIIISGGIFYLLRYSNGLENKNERLEEENTKLKILLKIGGKNEMTAKEKIEQKGQFPNLIKRCCFCSCRQKRLQEKNRSDMLFPT